MLALYHINSDLSRGRDAAPARGSASGLRQGFAPAPHKGSAPVPGRERAAPCTPQSTLPLVTSLTLYKRPTLLSLADTYGYGYRATSSVLYTVYCEITCGGTPPVGANTVRQPNTRSPACPKSKKGGIPPFYHDYLSVTAASAVVTSAASVTAAGAALYSGLGGVCADKDVISLVESALLI